MANDVGALFTEVSCVKLDAMMAILTRCMDRLSDEQVWARGGEHENAVGNLLLHLDGNIRQWILHGIGGQPDLRDRDSEFAARDGAGAGELLARLRATVEEAVVLFRALPAARL